MTLTKKNLILSNRNRFSKNSNVVIGWIGKKPVAYNLSSQKDLRLIPGNISNMLIFKNKDEKSMKIIIRGFVKDQNWTSKHELICRMCYSNGMYGRDVYETLVKYNMILGGSEDD